MKQQRYMVGKTPKTKFSNHKLKLQLTININAKSSCSSLYDNCTTNDTCQNLDKTKFNLSNHFLEIFLKQRHWGNSYKFISNNLLF